MAPGELLRKLSASQCTLHNRLLKPATHVECPPPKSEPPPLLDSHCVARVPTSAVECPAPPCTGVRNMHSGDNKTVIVFILERALCFHSPARFRRPL